jgi:glutamine cyclotransferase
MNYNIKIILLLIILLSCDNKNTNNYNSPRIKSNLKIISPSFNEIIKKGDSINIEVFSNSKKNRIIESTIYFQHDTIKFLSTLNVSSNELSRYGRHNFSIVSKFNDGSTEKINKSFLLYPQNKPTNKNYSIIKILPHDPNTYTQGLLIDQEDFLESSGQYGKSFIRRINFKTGEIINEKKIDEKLFAEGITTYGNKLYMLSWKSNKGIIFNKNNFKIIGEIQYDTEGWGLTSYKNNLIMSDGTEKLYFKDPITFKTQKIIEVYDNNGKVENINELEFINGKIYCNIYGKDIILIIDPDTGLVESRINLNNLFKRENYNDKIDVLNGIAYNKDNNSIIVTGKWWPSMYELKIN